MVSPALTVSLWRGGLGLPSPPPCLPGWGCCTGLWRGAGDIADGGSLG